MNTSSDLPRVIAYTRVSTEEQAISGLGLADQRQVLETEAARRGWRVVCLLEDEGWTAANLKRPAISQALRMLADGDAEVLVVAKLDRLSRSLLDFASLMDRAQREGWQLVVLDLGVDTSTPAGEMMANVMASFAQYERRLIGQRTKAALAQRKRQGVRLGRPRSLHDSVVARIVDARQAGHTLRSIADALNADEVPTARNGRCWYPSTVAAVLRSAELDLESLSNSH